ncbi:PREDICTED: GTPase-activating Rap/Ran-GAP domain-like protein 3 [Thamnophis sirtalis]|uniref:GTPase-activating Rap/Ran-GAP domain-like protein 3 n=1 Tax=Thamnophis sirtalis TaxID=35019 RepID=A0A6I9XA54_9SAUR|nr:PREDICTED: GTPase-activating Rap/Ran-GAP domain-like protein 3 [Thamnophis sirtalis]
MVPKVITTPTSSGVSSILVAPSLSLSRIEIKEIASRTRKELLGLLNAPPSKSEGGPKQKKLPSKQSDPPKQGTLRSSSSDRLVVTSFESPSEEPPFSTGSDVDPVPLEEEEQEQEQEEKEEEQEEKEKEQEGQPSARFQLGASFDEGVIDLK